MTITYSTNTTGPGLHDSPEASSTPNETSPLLQTKSALLSQRSLSERWHSNASAFLDRNAGLLLIAASHFFLSASNISVQWLNRLEEHVPILELIWIRMAMIYVFSISYLYWQKIPNPLLGPKDVRPLLVLRGFTGFTALSGMYFSLQYLSYSDAVVLRYIAPILTGLSGAIFLKERLFLKQFIAGLCSLFGVALVARPEFLFGGLPGNLLDVVTPQQRTISVIAALVGVVGATGTHTVLRAIGKRAHPLHVNALFSSQCVVFSTIGMRIFRISPVIPTRVLWLAIMFFVGVLSLIGQTLLAMGFQRETASRGSLAGYTSLVFAVFFQYVVFHTTPTPFSIAGATVIMSAAIYVSLTKQSTTSTQPATDASFERGAPVTSARDDDREAR